MNTRHDDENAQLRPAGRDLALVCAVKVLTNLHFFSAVLIPFFTQWGGLRLSDVFLLNAWFMLWNTLLDAPTGAFADRFGRRISMVAGSFAMAAGALAYVAVPHIAMFLVAEVVFAFGFALHSGADEAVVVDAFRRAGRDDAGRRWVPRLQSFALAGMLLGAVSGSWLAASGGLRAPLAWFAAPALLSGLLALGIREPARDAATAERSFAAWARTLRDGFRHVLSTPGLAAGAALVSAANALAWSMIWLYQHLLERARIAIQWFGMVHAAAVVGEILVLWAATTLSRGDRGRRRLLPVLVLVAGFAFVGCALVASPVALVGCIVIAFAAGLTGMPLFRSLVHAAAPSDCRATVLSAISTLQSLCIALCNLAVGRGADRSPSATLAVAGLLLVLLAVPAAFAVARLQFREQQP